MSKKVKSIICIIIAAVSWGLFPSLNRILYSYGYSVIQVTAARAFVAAAVYLVWGIAKGVFKGIRFSDCVFFLFYGCAAVLSTYVFYSLAIKEISPPMASVLLYTAPAFVIIFSAVIYKEPITKIKFTALLMTLAGSCLTVKIYDFESLKVSFTGIIFGLLSGIGYSMLTVIGKYAVKKYSPLQNTFIPAYAVAIVLIFICPPSKINISFDISLACLIGTGIFGSVIPYFFYLRGLDMGIDGANASLLSNIEPLVAVLCGVIFFKDTLSALQIAGIAITLSGAVFPNIAPSILNLKEKTEI